MQYKHLFEEIVYNGNFYGNYNYEKADILGNSIISFIGPCNIKDHMVDLKDIKMQEFITSNNMLHFIIELFDTRSLREAVLMQRLFIQKCIELINDYLEGDTRCVQRVWREGDDVIEASSGGKLSVSIATLSPISSLIHVGLNITTEGTPEEIHCSCLSDFDINPVSFAEGCANRFMNEFNDVNEACWKVKGVR